MIWSDICPSMSLLGMVPLLPKSDTASGSLLLPINAWGPAAESFRTIRTSLLLANPSELPLCVLITSPGESEGKTTLAVNLARATAQLEDTRVILIDADLRKAHPHPIFKIQTGNGKPKGLVDFLTGSAGLQEIVYQTEVANLFVIPSGECPANPSELLHSKHMSQLLTIVSRTRVSRYPGCPAGSASGRSCNPGTAGRWRAPGRQCRRDHPRSMSVSCSTFDDFGREISWNRSSEGPSHRLPVLLRTLYEQSVTELSRILSRLSVKFRRLPWLQLINCYLNHP